MIDNHTTLPHGYRISEALLCFLHKKKLSTSIKISGLLYPDIIKGRRELREKGEGEETPEETLG